MRQILSIVLGALGVIAAVANHHGAVDMLIGGLVWFAIGGGIGWIIDRLTKRRVVRPTLATSPRHIDRRDLSTINANLIKIGASK